MAAGCTESDPQSDGAVTAESERSAADRARLKKGPIPAMGRDEFMQRACDAAEEFLPFWPSGKTAASTPVAAPPSGPAKISSPPPGSPPPLGVFGPDGSAQASIGSPNVCVAIWRSDENRFFLPQAESVSVSLSQDYLPIPQARWEAGKGIDVQTELTGLSPDTHDGAGIFVYRVQLFNRSGRDCSVRICIMVRPHRLDGSAAPLGAIVVKDDTLCTVGDSGVIKLPSSPAFHGAIDSGRDDGSGPYLFVYDAEVGAVEGEYAAATPVVDFNILLAPSPTDRWPDTKKIRINYARSHIDWASTDCLNEVRFHTPSKQLADTWRAALSRLIMAARSGASTGGGVGKTLFSAPAFATVETTAAATALNRAGRFDEARLLLDRFDALIGAEGQIPRALDGKGQPLGPDAPAWNSLTLVALTDHFRFTGDRDWLAGKKDLILSAAGRLEKYGANTTPRGFVRPSDANTAVCFADSFDVVNGLEEAALAASEIGLEEEARRFSKQAGALRDRLREVIPVVMEEARINFIPAGPDKGLVRADDPERGHNRLTAHDAIDLGRCAWPGTIFNAKDRWSGRSIELNWIMFFEQSGGGLRSDALFLPEGMELASPMLALRKEKYPSLILEWYAAHTTMTGAHTWAEILAGRDAIGHKDPSLRADAAYVTLMRNIFVMERGDYLFLGPGLTLRWFEIAKEMGIENAPTAFGRVSFRMTTEKLKSTVDFLDTSALPPRGYMMNQVYPSQKPPITVDGKPYTPAIQNYLLIFPPGTKSIEIEW